MERCGCWANPSPIEELHKYQQEAESKAFYWSDSKRTHALRLAIKEAKLFILGKPGAGKTTFLKYLALQADQLKKLPIFVSLNEWAESRLDLLPFIEQQFTICQFPSARDFIEQLFQQGKALVLFDGLDEVNEAADKRLMTSRTLANFSQQYYKNDIIITCRIAATDFSFDKFTYVELADFTNEQAEAFVRKWFAESPKTADNFWQELQHDSRRGLQELAHSPLLLTLLCLNYEETLTFPARRVEIYEEALEALLKKWDSSRGIKRDEVYKGLSLGRKRQLLAFVAADYFQRGQIFFPQLELARKMEVFLARLSAIESGPTPEGDVIIKAIEAQHGLLVERAKGIYSFSHLTLQEYFTARYIHEHSEPNIVKSLMTHAADPQWREVFLLTSSLLSEGDDFFRDFRITLDDRVTNSQNLNLFFRWLAPKAKDYKITEYLVSASDLNRALNRDLSSALDRALASTLASALDIASASASDHDRFRALARARFRAINGANARAIHHQRHHQRPRQCFCHRQRPCQRLRSRQCQ